VAAARAQTTYVDDELSGLDWALILLCGNIAFILGIIRLVQGLRDCDLAGLACRQLQIIVGEQTTRSRHESLIGAVDVGLVAIDA
jgi:hypothetical protein